MSLRIAPALAFVLVLAGCSHKTATEPWPPNTDPGVFSDRFSAGVGFQAFAGSKLDAIAVDSTTKFQGVAALKFTVPAPGDPSGTYAGGAFVAATPHDLSAYNAFSFWVKASRTATLDVAGIGNDNTGTSKYEAKRANIPMSTAWSHVIIPIPDAAKLASEKGMFFLAEGPQAGAGLTVWVDQAEFVSLPALAVNAPKPKLNPATVNAFAGTSLSLAGRTHTVFNAGAPDTALDVQHAAAYFTILSSNTAVVAIENGVPRVVGAGSASVTAKLGAVDATGAITVNATAPPATAPPAPTLPQAQVISLFSGTYTNVPVDTWSATWDVADVSDITIAGNPAKVYTNLSYAGIEFTSHVIDATAMTAFHIDVYAPTGTTFKVKLVDFGANGIYGGNDDVQHELTFNAASTPAFTPAGWASLDIPLADFTALTTRGHLAQLILSGDVGTAFVDNLYFHQ